MVLFSRFYYLVVFRGTCPVPPFFSFYTGFYYFVINTIFTEIFLEYDKEDNY